MLHWSVSSEQYNMVEEVGGNRVVTKVYPLTVIEDWIAWMCPARHLSECKAEPTPCNVVTNYQNLVNLRSCNSRT